MKQYLIQQRREKREKRQAKDEKKNFVIYDPGRESSAEADFSVFTQSQSNDNNVSGSSGSGSSRAGGTSESSVLKQLCHY